MCVLPADVTNEVDNLDAHYRDFEFMNRGGNGYLYFATNRVTHQDVAIKFYFGDPGEQRHDEPRKLAANEAENILPILDAREISDDWAYFITPRCREGDLDDLIALRPSVHVAIDTIIGICNGVGGMHVRRMVHRDLKPGNIVVQDGRPQIADFGSVRALPDGQDKTSPDYS